MRGATCSKSHFCNFSKFLLTHLLRGATLNALELCCTEVISTHAPLARCNGILFIFLPNSCISTHAPLARCNILMLGTLWTLYNFYSRTSCEVQHQDIQDKSPFLKFLLTHLLRGATGKDIIPYGMWKIISTHAPLARCNYYSSLTYSGFEISTHAPLARCNELENLIFDELQNFYSRTSCEVQLFILIKTF